MLPHQSHSLKAWTGDVGKRTIFCAVCGKEENEEAIKEPCPGKFIASRDPQRVDTASKKD